MEQIGKTVILAGLVLVLIGSIFFFGPKIPLIGKLGRLPGDIHIQKENFSFHFPLMTSIILSILFSAVFYIISRFR